MLRRILEEAREWIKVLNEKIHSLHSSSNISKKLGRWDWQYMQHTCKLIDIHIKLWHERLMRTNRWEDLHLAGRIILKRILKKQAGRTWSRII
jgi:hypothetical protein